MLDVRIGWVGGEIEKEEEEVHHDGVAGEVGGIAHCLLFYRVGGWVGGLSRGGGGGWNEVLDAMGWIGRGAGGGLNELLYVGGMGWVGG